jgi:nucleotide-binding universal stress UspA family protein
MPVPRRGFARRSIVRYADEIGAGLILMTTHGRTGLERLLLGSVTEGVLRSARVPVLVKRMAAIPAGVSASP